MTNAGFPLEGPYTFDSEAELAGACAGALGRANWVVKRFSAHRSLPAQMRGWVDIVAVRDDHVLLIECKGPDGELEPEQEKFRDAVWPHARRHVRYIELVDLRQLEVQWLIPTIEVKRQAG